MKISEEEFEKKLRKGTEAQGNGTWYTPAPDDWLRKKSWTVKQALLLFAGLNPLVNEITWQMNGYPVHLCRAERIGREFGDPSTYSMMSREELNREWNRIRNDARERMEMYREKMPDDMRSLREWMDTDADDQCKKWLGYYEESEKLLTFLLEKWEETIDEDLDRRLPTKIFLGWALSQNLTDKIPWWLEATCLEKIEQSISINIAGGQQGGSAREALRKGGRPPSPLRAAVEYLYGKLYDSGDHECLRSGGIQLFMKKFKEAVRKDDYITERIERISLSGGKWTIKTQEITAKEDSQRVVMQKSKTYVQNKISKILTELRKKRSIE